MKHYTMKKMSTIKKHKGKQRVNHQLYKVSVCNMLWQYLSNVYVHETVHNRLLWLIPSFCTFV